MLAASSGPTCSSASIENTQSPVAASSAPFFGCSRRFWVGAAVCTFVTSALEPLVPALLKPLIDRGFRTDDPLQLWLVPTALMLLFTVRGVAGFLADLALARISQDGLMAL